MKKSLSLLILALIFSVRAVLACDACSMYEFSPLQAKSFIGVFYNYSFFNGYKSLSQPARFTFNASNLHLGELHDDEGTKADKRDYEMYQTIDFRFNYNHQNKWNFFVNVPFEMNAVYFEKYSVQSGIAQNRLDQASGIGDILLVGERISVVNSEKAKHVFKYGLGLFVPTGELDLIDDDGNLNHVIHYPGRGNFETMLRLSYSCKVQDKYGLMLLSSYTLGTSMTAADYNYSFGKRLNIQSNAFYTKALSDELKLIPMTGLYYEQIASHQVNELNVAGTEADVVLYNVSLGAKLKSILLRVEYQHPIWQREVAYQLQNAGRFNLMMTYNL